MRTYSTLVEENVTRVKVVEQLWNNCGTAAEKVWNAREHFMNVKQYLCGYEC